MQGTSAPWAPAQPLLQNIISQAEGIPTGVTSGQTNATNTLTNATNWLPNFTPGATNLTNNLFGYSTTPQQNLSNSAYGNLQSTLSPYLSSSYLNPMNTPGLSTALQGLTNTISNGVNDSFAAAGRDLSPGNSTALAYGLEQGEAPVLAAQYNQNVSNQLNAANNLFGAGNTTAGALTQEQLAQLGVNTQGLTAATAIPGVATAPGGAQLSVANTSANLPYQDLGWLSGLVSPIAALGGQTSATGTTTQQTSPISNILAGGLGGVGLLSLFSDERLKDDIAPVGMLYDGQTIFSYKYKGDDIPRIGLMAQQVEKVRPDAVVEIGPAKLKAVNYGTATQNSKYLGLLADLFADLEI